MATVECVVMCVVLQKLIAAIYGVVICANQAYCTLIVVFGDVVELLTLNLFLEGA